MADAGFEWMMTDCRCWHNGCISGLIAPMRASVQSSKTIPIGQDKVASFVAREQKVCCVCVQNITILLSLLQSFPSWLGRVEGTCHSRRRDNTSFLP
jgi:hypothetical protein